jgi:hypothetical protein
MSDNFIKTYSAQEFIGALRMGQLPLYHKYATGIEPLLQALEYVAEKISDLPPTFTVSFEFRTRKVPATGQLWIGMIAARGAEP